MTGKSFAPTPWLGGTRTPWLATTATGICFGLLLAGCTAIIADGQQGTTDPDGPVGAGAGTATPAAECQELQPAVTERRLRRLSAREYANVVSELLGPDAGAEVLQKLPPEARVGGFDNQDAALSVTPSFQSILAELAEQLAKAAEPARLAPCDTPSGSPTCLASFIDSFTSQAYGRPLTDAERERVASVAALGEDYATSVRLVIELALQSPHFLYVSELGPEEAEPAPGQPVTLTSYEVASQLSFLLRGARPDAELLQKAEANALAHPEEIRAEAQRLLQQPRVRAELGRFVAGWLDMAPIAEAPKSSEAFPELTETVVAAMQQEYDDFLTAHLGAGEGTIFELLTARSTDIPAALLPIYGDDYTAGNGLDPKRRMGILSLPGVLTYHASFQHSGPVERGLFVRQHLLCQSVPAPPQTILDLIQDNPIDIHATDLTTREKFEVHLDEPSCASCHQMFDPIGFGLEEMDGIGRYRTTENGRPVDSTGELTGTDIDGPFEGIAELSGKLAESAVIEECLVDHFFRFAQSRATAAADRCVVQEWASSFSEGGGRISDLILAYVTHPTFINRTDDR